MRNEQDRRNIFFLGRVHEPDSDNYFIFFTILLFQFHIWEQKLRKKIPSFNTLNLSFRESVLQLLRGNSHARKEISKSNFILCRKLNHGAAPDYGHQPSRDAAALPRGGNE